MRRWIVHCYYNPTWWEEYYLSLESAKIRAKYLNKHQNQIVGVFAENPLKRIGYYDSDGKWYER